MSITKAITIGIWSFFLAVFPGFVFSATFQNLIQQAVQCPTGKEMRFSLKSPDSLNPKVMSRLSSAPLGGSLASEERNIRLDVCESQNKYTLKRVVLKFIVSGMVQNKMLTIEDGISTIQIVKTEDGSNVLKIPRTLVRISHLEEALFSNLRDFEILVPLTYANTSNSDPKVWPSSWIFVWTYSSENTNLIAAGAGFTWEGVHTFSHAQVPAGLFEMRDSFDTKNRLCEEPWVPEKLTMEGGLVRVVSNVCMSYRGSAFGGYSRIYKPYSIQIEDKDPRGVAKVTLNKEELKKLVTDQTHHNFLDIYEIHTKDIIYHFDIIGFQSLKYRYTYPAGNSVEGAGDFRSTSD